MLTESGMPRIDETFDASLPSRHVGAEEPDGLRGRTKLDA